MAKNHPGQFGQPGRDPRAEGRKGGKATAGPGDQRALAKLAADDAGLREMAQRVFRDALQSEIPSERLAAAKAIASVAPERPVPESQRKGWQTEYAGLPTKDLIESIKTLNSTGMTMGDGNDFGVLPSPGEIMRKAEKLKESDDT